MMIEVQLIIVQGMITRNISELLTNEQWIIFPYIYTAFSHLPDNTVLLLLMGALWAWLDYAFSA